MFAFLKNNRYGVSKIKQEITSIENSLITEAATKLGITDLAHASIREIVALTQFLEKQSGIPFLRMDMGVPGLPPPDIGVKAEIAALESGVASRYANIDGLPDLKKEISLFVSNFLNINVKPSSCIVSVGSMQGAMASFMVAGRRKGTDHKVLFIDPGFPVQKKQVEVLHLESIRFDIYDYRGKKLKAKLEEICQQNKISVIIYSSPNNPAWYCLTEDELQYMGEIANKYDIVIIEDLAYFAMDFRRDYSQPGKPPFQPTVANYTDNYLLLISSSKIFSYAGQRVASVVMSDSLADKEFPTLLSYGSYTRFGTAMIMDGIYVLSAGASHSAQYGLLAMLKAVNNGELNLTEKVREYALRAGKIKKVFLQNGFYIVYAKDDKEEISDGFFFTVAYPGMKSDKLIRELLRVGISAISLVITGSTNENGIRICVSQIDSSKFDLLDERLRMFRNNQS